MELKDDECDNIYKAGFEDNYKDSSECSKHLSENIKDDEHSILLYDRPVDTRGRDYRLHFKEIIDRIS